MSLKHKWPISLQITTQCAYDLDKVWGLPYNFNLPNIKESVLYFFCNVIFYINDLLPAELSTWCHM